MTFDFDFNTFNEASNQQIKEKGRREVVKGVQLKRKVVDSELVAKISIHLASQHLHILASGYRDISEHVYRYRSTNEKREIQKHVLFSCTPTNSNYNTEDKQRRKTMKKTLLQKQEDEDEERLVVYVLHDYLC